MATKVSVLESFHLVNRPVMKKIQSQGVRGAGETPACSPSTLVCRVLLKEDEKFHRGTLIRESIFSAHLSKDGW